MLIHDDHFSVLHSALEFQSKVDENIHFFCSASFDELKDTSHWSSNELAVLLPDVSVTKLDEIDSFSDVISEVLSTHLLDIKITNYGLRTAAWQRDGLLGRRRRRRDGRAAQARRGQDRGGGQRSQKGSAVS